MDRRSWSQTNLPHNSTVGEVHNGVQLDPVTYLITLLHERFGPLQEETRLQAMMEMMHFHRKPGESTATFLMRYDLARQKAAVEGGYALNVETSAAIMLNMLGPHSKEKIQLLLQPTNYSLPRTEPEFRALLDHLRRLARLEEHVPGNIADAINGQSRVRSAYWTDHSSGSVPDQAADHSSTFMMGWGSGSSSSTGGGNPAQHTSTGWTPSWQQPSAQSEQHAYLGGNDDDSEFTSTSATSSDDGHEEIPIDSTLASIESENQAAEHIYLQYRRHKRMWRRFTGRPVRKFRRKFKKYSHRKHHFYGGGGKGGHWRDRLRGGGSGGHGHGKGGKGRMRFFQANPDEVAAFASSMGKGGKKGSGGGFGRKGNPTGKDGKPLTCHSCGSTEHLIRDCPQRSGGHMVSQPSYFQVGSDMAALAAGADVVNSTGTPAPQGATLFTTQDSTSFVSMTLTAFTDDPPPPTPTHNRPQKTKKFLCGTYCDCHDHTFTMMNANDDSHNTPTYNNAQQQDQLTTNDP